MGTLEFYYHHFGIILLVQYFCILLSTFRYFSFSFQYWILSYHYLLWNYLNRVAACLDVSNQNFFFESFLLDPLSLPGLLTLQMGCLLCPQTWQSKKFSSVYIIISMSTLYQKYFGPIVLVVTLLIINSLYQRNIKSLHSTDRILSSVLQYSIGSA